MVPIAVILSYLTSVSLAYYFLEFQLFRLIQKPNINQASSLIPVRVTPTLVLGENSTEEIYLSIFRKRSRKNQTACLFKKVQYLKQICLYSRRNTGLCQVYQPHLCYAAEVPQTSACANHPTQPCWATHPGEAKPSPPKSSTSDSIGLTLPKGTLRLYIVISLFSLQQAATGIMYVEHKRDVKDPAYQDPSGIGKR